MQIESLKVGELRTNCYIVKDNGEAVVIDPGGESDKIIKLLADVKTVAIILTHGHYDHVTDAFNLKEKTKAPVLIHEDDEAMMVFTTQERADGLLKNGDAVTVGKEKFEIIHTPGHTRGGMCLYNSKEKILFSGDTLFYKTYGRTDLPGGDESQMEDSLKKLLKLPHDTVVYPGHGQGTTIKGEKDLII